MGADPRSFCWWLGGEDPPELSRGWRQAVLLQCNLSTVRLEQKNKFLKLGTARGTHSVPRAVAVAWNGLVSWPPRTAVSECHGSGSLGSEAGQPAGHTLPCRRLVLVLA